MNAGHPGKTEAQTEVDATSGAGVVKAVPHPAVCWEGSCERVETLLYDVLHGHGGQGRLGGELQDVEHPQMVPQTGWSTAR